MIRRLLFAGIENSCRVMKNLTAEARVKKIKTEICSTWSMLGESVSFPNSNHFWNESAYYFVSTPVVIHILIYLLAGTREQFTT